MTGRRIFNGAPFHQGAVPMEQRVLCSCLVESRVCPVDEGSNLRLHSFVVAIMFSSSSCHEGSTMHHAWSMMRSFLPHPIQIIGLGFVFSRLVQKRGETFLLVERGLDLSILRRQTLRRPRPKMAIDLTCS